MKYFVLVLLAVSIVSIVLTFFCSQEPAWSVFEKQLRRTLFLLPFTCSPYRPVSVGLASLPFDYKGKDNF